MHLLIEPLQITLPAGPFNGSSIVDPQMKPMEQHLLPALATQRGLELFGEAGVDIWLFTNEHWFMRTIETEPIVIEDFTPHVAITCKLVGLKPDPALLIRCEQAMQHALSAQATAARSQSYYLDVTPPGHDKGTFVKAMAKRLGISTDAVAVIGDTPNDLSMFAVGGFSVAMGNASEEVKKHARRVTASNEEEGLALAVEIILQEAGR